MYSLGIVFYEALSGTRPFEDARATGLLRKHIEEPLPDPKLGRAHVPDAVARLVVWMTQKNPAARPGSYRELVAALDAALPPDPALLSAPSWWPLSDLRAALKTGTGWRLAWFWTLATALSTWSGALNVAWDWNAIPLSLGPVSFDVTFYPAFTLGLLCAIWLGPAWGAVPTYLANLVGAVYGGVPFPVNTLFAAAGVIELLILWGLFVAFDIDPDLKRPRDFLWFVASTVVAAVIGSTSVIVWNASRGHDFSTGQRLWYGWVIGDVLQAALLAGPCVWWLGPRVRSWVRRQMATEPRSEASQTQIAVTLATVLAALGVLVFAGFGMVQDSLERDLATMAGRAELRLRLYQMQLFIGILVFALVVATALVSTTLARKGVTERRGRDAL